MRRHPAYRKSMKPWPFAFFAPLALLIAALPLAAIAQPAPPSPASLTTPTTPAIDLKSAYCIAVLKRNVADMEDAAKAYPEGPMRDMGNETAKEYGESLRRLHAYLGPKLGSIESESLVAASKRGEQDIEATSAAQRSCAVQCKSNDPVSVVSQNYVRCLATCIQQVPAAARTGACTPVDWLPD